MATVAGRRPSEGWASYEDWNFDGFRERLELFMKQIDKTALTRHVETLMGKKATMSVPFSAGQYWCCFELVLDGESLVVARVRLPRHPEASELVDEASERYGIECEVATMKFMQDNARTISSPRLYAYEPPGSESAIRVGACYMLIEGFYGNTLQDVQFDICRLPSPIRENVITQWTAVQVELASFVFPAIGSICSYTDSSGATIGKLACAVAERYPSGGPFETAQDFFLATAEAGYAAARANAAERTGSDLQAGMEQAAGEEEEEDEVWRTLGPYIFLSIVRDTDIFASGPGNDGPFLLSHMDMGTQNVLVDSNLNLIAVIDWEFAQAAPVHVNHYPMPFPLIDSDSRNASILADPQHIAYRNVSVQDETRKLYRQKLIEAEQALAKKGRPLQHSIAEHLDSTASRIFAVAEYLKYADGQRQDRTTEMVRLAFGFEGEQAKKYIKDMENEMKASDSAI